MPLMEKAYAKFNQNYERIEAGGGGEGLSLITGDPVGSINPRRMSKNTYWKYLQEISSRNYPATAGAKNKVYGIITKHAYSVLDTAVLRDGNGNIRHRLV